jgi:hypothetical protein
MALVDFDHIFWCSSYAMFRDAAGAARPQSTAPCAARAVTSSVVLLLTLLLISIGIALPIATG